MLGAMSVLVTGCFLIGLAPTWIAPVIAQAVAEANARKMPATIAVSPDFAGFRSAVCRGARGSALDATLLHGLAEAVKGRRSPAPG